MREISTNSFGLVIAYLLPGFVALAGAGLFSETVRSWMSASPESAPTVGGFLYVTLASLAAGLIVSTIRWAVIDTIHHRTGLAEPEWNFGVLQEKFEAFEGLVENHYRYYQMHANLMIATASTFLAYWLSKGLPTVPVWFGFLMVECILWAGSRDTLRKYYERSESLLNGRDRAAMERRATSGRQGSGYGRRTVEGPFR